MTRMVISRAAAALLRALLATVADARYRIILSEIVSIDWQSLTFVGERHRIELRISGPDPEALARLLTAGISDREFEIPGQIVADIGIEDGPDRLADGSIRLRLEALTIREE